MYIQCTYTKVIRTCMYMYVHVCTCTEGLHVCWPCIVAQQLNREFWYNNYNTSSSCNVYSAWDSVERPGRSCLLWATWLGCFGQDDCFLLDWLMIMKLLLKNYVTSEGVVSQNVLYYQSTYQQLSIACYQRLF